MAYLLLINGGLSTLLGLFLAHQNHQKYNLRADFSRVMVFAGIWVFCVGLIFRTQGSITATNINYLAALAMVYSLMAFAMRLRGLQRKQIKFVQVVGTGVVGFLALMLAIDANWIITQTRFSSDGVAVVTGTIGYPLYALFFVSPFLGMSYHFLRLAIKSVQDLRKYALILVAIVITGVTGLYTNLYIPTLGDYSWIWASPLMVSLVVFSTGFSIVQYKTFEIRLLVARSFTYSLVVGSLIGIYGFVIFAISLIFSDGTSTNLTQQVSYLTAAIFLAFTFQPIKRRFDVITARLFFKDSYDPQVLIDTLNKTLASTVDLEVMLEQSISVIGQNIKPDFCFIELRQTAYREQRIFGTRPRSLTKETLAQLRKDLPTIEQKVVSAELLSQSSRPRKILEQHSIGMLCRLSADPSAEDIGYVVLGLKKSGDQYANQDRQVMEIISNGLVIAIENALRFEEIQQFNVTLQQKIDNATKQLKHANDKLVELNDTKDDFISMASHQLRTPLTAVKGNISMIMDQDFGKIPASVQEPLGQAYASSERMVGLIADLLNVSRLKTGKFAIQPVPSNLDTVVKSELKQLQEAAKAHKLTLTYHAPASFPTFMLDEIKVRQVIMNFIDNAIYYTPSGGRIDVTLRKRTNAIEFTVADNGIGVPRELQRNLFTKFYRADNAQKMRPDGTGIGLFMAKKVIVASGGSVIFRSTEGKGSTFGFTIPLTKLPKPPTTQA
jgi:signal transduction histidine kinase